MRLFTLIALALFALPALASRDCADNTDRLSADLAATYGTPFTLALYVKVADHPASFDYAMSLLEQGSTSSSPSAVLLFGSTADRYNARVRDSGGTTSLAVYDSAAGEYDGVWMGWVGVFTSATSRDVYIDSVNNTNNNATNINIGTALQQLTLCNFPTGTGSAMTGKVAEPAVWDSALSAADIEDYLDNRMAANCLTETPDAYYSLSTNSLDDESGNGNTTLTNDGADFDSMDHPSITGCATDDFILQRRRLQ